MRDRVCKAVGVGDAHAMQAAPSGTTTHGRRPAVDVRADRAMHANWPAPTNISRGGRARGRGGQLACARYVRRAGADGAHGDSWPTRTAQALIAAARFAGVHSMADLARAAHADPRWHVVRTVREAKLVCARGPPTAPTGRMAEVARDFARLSRSGLSLRVGFKADWAVFA